MPRLREVGAPSRELAKGEPVGVLRRLGRALVADAVEESHRHERAEGAFEIEPERVHVLEPDREPEQAGRHARALPARSRLDARRHAAEARHVRDQGRRRLDPSRRVGVGHVEGEEATESGVPHLGHLRMRAKSLGDDCRTLRLSRHAYLERLETAEQEPGSVGRGNRARVCAELQQPRRILGPLADDGADERVVVAGEVLRGRVDRKVAAELERTDVQRRRRGRVARHAGGMRCGRREVRHRQERVRGRLEPDEVDTVRRCAGLVELDLLDPPARELVEQHARSVVRTFGDRNRLPGGEERQHHRRARCGAGREQQRVASVELSEPSLGLHQRRAREARVREATGLAVLVGPRRRAVDRRRSHGGEAITGRLSRR